MIQDLVSIGTGVGVGAVAGRRVARGAVRRSIADAIESRVASVAARDEAVKVATRQAALQAPDGAAALSATGIVDCPRPSSLRGPRSLLASRMCDLSPKNPIIWGVFRPTPGLQRHVGAPAPYPRMQPSSASPLRRHTAMAPEHPLASANDQSMSDEVARALPNGAYFDLPISAMASTPTIPARVSTGDIARLSDLSRQVRTVLATFGGQNSEIYCLGDRIRIYAGTEVDSRLPIVGDSNLPALMRMTADELTANAALETPKLHAEALTSPSLVGILRAVATRNPSEHAVPTYHDADGDHPIPVLTPAAFVQPATNRKRILSQTMRVVGCHTDRHHGMTYLLTEEHLCVRFSPELEAQMLALPMSAIRGGLWYTGTIVQDDGVSWATAPGGTITHQPGL